MLKISIEEIRKKINYNEKEIERIEQEFLKKELEAEKELNLIHDQHIIEKESLLRENNEKLDKAKEAFRKSKEMNDLINLKNDKIQLKKLINRSKQISLELNAIVKAKQKILQSKIRPIIKEKKLQLKSLIAQIKGLNKQLAYLTKINT